jgi:hypothetical protein
VVQFEQRGPRFQRRVCSEDDLNDGQKKKSMTCRDTNNVQNTFAQLRDSLQEVVTV